MKQISALTMNDPIDEYLGRNKSQREFILQELLQDDSSSVSTVASDPTADLTHGMDSKQFEASLSEMGCYNLELSQFSKERLSIPESMSMSLPSESFFSRWEHSCSDSSIPLRPAQGLNEPVSDDDVVSLSFFSVDVEAVVNGRIQRPLKETVDPKLLSPIVTERNTIGKFEGPIKLGSLAPVKSPRHLPSMDSLFPKSDGGVRPPVSPRRSVPKQELSLPELGDAVPLSPRRMPSLTSLFPDQGSSMQDRVAISALR